MNWISVTNVSGPDGLEAWCVALAACAINFVMAGLGRMSGILYVAFIDTYQIGRREASLPFSVRSSLRNLLGPVVGILGEKYGARPVIITGGILGVLSAASCFYVTDILWMTIMWGGISGSAAALTTTLNQAVIGQHFKKYRTTAAGIAFSGGCVGSFLFPVLLEWLLHTYKLGGTFLIIAGILMHVLPASLIMKKPSWFNNKKRKEIPVPVPTISNDIKSVTKFKQTRNEKGGTASYSNYGYVNDSLSKKEIYYSQNENVSKNDPIFYCQKNVSDEPCTKMSIDKDVLWKNRKLVIRILTNNFQLKAPLPNVNPNKHFCNGDLLKEIEELFYKIAKDVHNEVAIFANTATTASTKTHSSVIESKDIFYVCRTSNIQLMDMTFMMSSNPLNCLYTCLDKLFQNERIDILQAVSNAEHENIDSILEELWNLYLIIQNNVSNPCSYAQNNSVTLNSRTKNTDHEYSNTFCSHIKTACNLYTKPLFLMICLCRFVHFMTFMPVMTTIVDFSMDKGLPKEDGKYVIAALSLGDLIGRLCLGWITDRGYVTLPRYMMCVMVIQGVSTATLSLMNSRALLMPAIVVAGLLQGSVFVRHPVLVSRYLESHEQSIAMGCLNLFSGFIGFILPSYIGYFRDTIGSYDGMLYINGASLAFVGLLWIFEPYFFIKSKPRTET